MLDYDDDNGSDIQPLTPADSIPTEIQAYIVGEVNAVLNRWFNDTDGLPYTLTIAKLGTAIAGMMQKAYLDWRKSGKLSDSL